MRALLLCALLAGCATNEPAVVRVPVEVKVPVPVPCLNLNDVPKLPMLASDADLAALPGRELIITIEIHRRELRSWREQVGPMLSACAKD